MSENAPVEERAREDEQEMEDVAQSSQTRRRKRKQAQRILDEDEDVAVAVVNVEDKREDGGIFSDAIPTETGTAGLSAAPSSASHSLARSKLLCAVKVPGRIENVQHAAAAVGGPGAVLAAMRKPGAKLNYRMARPYQFQAPLPMNRRRTADVLFRATKRADGSWQCAPLGVVGLTFTSETLADFLFVPGREFAHGENSVVGSVERELLGKVPDEHHPLYMPPPFFTKVDTPQPYNFQENPLVRQKKRAQKQIHLGSAIGTSEAKLKRSWINVHVAHFKDKDASAGGALVVPKDPPQGAQEQLNDHEKLLVNEMLRLFSERAIWLRGPLEEQLAQRLPDLTPTVTNMQRTLQVVAYFWADGPWRNAYVRLGWDPRVEPEARHFQVIDFRERYLRQSEAYFSVKHEGGAPEPSTSRAKVDHHFLCPPVQKSQLYQHIDIEDDGVKMLLKSSALRKTCSEVSGWFPPATMKLVRERMHVKSEIMRKASLSGPAPLMKLSDARSPGAGMESRCLQALPAAPETTVPAEAFDIRSAEAEEMESRCLQAESAAPEATVPVRFASRLRRPGGVRAVLGNCEAAVADPAAQKLPSCTLFDQSATSAAGPPLRTKRVRRICDEE